MAAPSKDNASLDTPISRSEMRKALIRSGYLLESRIESVLRERWGFTQANDSYPDPETGKSREFDVFAGRAERAGPMDDDWMFIDLVIECVNNPQPLVILTKETPLPIMHLEEVKMAGRPIKVPEEQSFNGWQPLHRFLEMQDYHHYCRGSIGTQFCSFHRKNNKQEWMALHEDVHFDAFKKVCDAVDYRIDRCFKSWTARHGKGVNITMFYPLIVVQGELIEARQTKRSVTLRAADHLQFFRSATTKRAEAAFQIDVIRERFLPKYVDLVEQEFLATAELLRARHDVIRAASDRILAEVKDIELPDEARTVIDYPRS